MFANSPASGEGLCPRARHDADPPKNFTPPNLKPGYAPVDWLQEMSIKMEYDDLLPF